MSRTSFSVLGLMLACSVATDPQEGTLPLVSSAAVPVYPKLPQQAHIQGVIKLRVTTDGKQATAIEIVSGQPMLAKDAKANIETWAFELHDPTTFDATFRYRLVKTKCDAKCNCEGVEKEQVIQRLPTEVEITAKQVIICEFLAEEVVTRLQIRHNSKLIAAPSNITFTIKGRSFDVAVRDGTYQVPPPVRNAKDVSLSFELPGILISTRVLHGGKLWTPNLTVVLEDRHFEDSSLTGSKARAACLIDFHDGTQMFDTACRRKAAN